MADGAVSASPAPPDRDASAIEALRDLGGEALAQELVALLLSYAPTRLELARAGLTSGDAAQVVAALHSLKSSCAQLGANGMRTLCASGEGVADRGDLGAVRPILEALDREWATCRQWLAATVASGGSSAPSE
jgi:two-component system, sensor histidine kinase and response regulator